MNNIIDENIDKYCIDFSTTHSKVINDLEEYTKKTQPAAVMLSGRLVASFLGFCIKMSNVKNALELGTFTGYTALAMAESLPDGGKITTIDSNKALSEENNKWWKKSESGNKIIEMLGNANNILDDLIQQKNKYDLIFIDADKENYINYLKKSLELLSENGVIVVDNVLWSGRVLIPEEELKKEVRGTTRSIKAFNEYIFSRKDLYKTLVPIRDGLFLIRNN